MVHSEDIRPEFQWSSLFVDVSVAGMFEGYLVNDY